MSTATRKKLLAIRESLDEFLEYEKQPSESISDHICDALDALDQAVLEWNLNWSRMRTDWENGEPIPTGRLGGK